MAEEATVDAYDEAEQAGGFFTMIEENLGAPFSTVVLGVEVTVKRIYLTEGDEIVAICSRGKLARALRCAHAPPPPAQCKSIVEQAARGIPQRRSANSAGGAKSAARSCGRYSDFDRTRMKSAGDSNASSN